jgi:hypothetical protein
MQDSGSEDEDDGGGVAAAAEAAGSGSGRQQDKLPVPAHLQALVQEAAQQAGAADGAQAGAVAAGPGGGRPRQPSHMQALVMEAAALYANFTGSKDRARCKQQAQLMLGQLELEGVSSGVQTELYLAAQGIIAQQLQAIRERWAAQQLPTLQRAAHLLWRALRRRQISELQEVVELLQLRLVDLVHKLASSNCSSRAELEAFRKHASK